MIMGQLRLFLQESIYCDTQKEYQQHMKTYYSYLISTFICSSALSVLIDPCMK